MKPYLWVMPMREICTGQGESCGKEALSPAACSCFLNCARLRDLGAFALCMCCVRHLGRAKRHFISSPHLPFGEGCWDAYHNNSPVRMLLKGCCRGMWKCNMSNALSWASALSGRWPVHQLEWFVKVYCTGGGGGCLLCFHMCIMHACQHPFTNAWKELILFVCPYK